MEIVDGRELLDGREQRLDPRVATVWATSSGVVAAIVGAVAVATALALDAPGPVVGAAVAAGLVLVVAALALARLSYRAWRWAASDDALELRHGVVIARESTVPYHRIQQIDIVRDPLERLLGLSSLVLRTASASSDSKIPGLAEASAAWLRRQLLARAGVDDAV